MTNLVRIALLATLAFAATGTRASLEAAGPPLAFFADPTFKTSNASIAVDSAGGTHLAFYYYEPANHQRPTYAVYAYCASQCDDDASWGSVGFGEFVREVELELTPAGTPRLLITAESAVYTAGKDYLYAACDAGCTQAAGWSFTRIASGWTSAIALDNDDELAQHAFELDGLGRPRFVYRDENYQISPPHSGLFYASCDLRCDDAAQWTHTRVTDTRSNAMERAYHPSLAITPDGRPRIVSAEFFPIGSTDPTLAYFACEAFCDDTASWQRVDLMLRGGGSEPSADLEVDVRGFPRIAFYQEALLNGQGKRLFYLTCDGQCLQRGNWAVVDLGLGTFNGQEPDLELDDQGRPRIAYADWHQGGPGVAACDATCSSASSWRHTLVEDRNVLHRAWPVAYPPHCDGGLWNALTPSLTLGPGGAPVLAYDATYHAHCLYDDDPTDTIPPVSKMHLITRAVRVVSMAAGAATPGAPTGLRAGVSGNTLTLHWNAPSAGSAPASYALVARFSAGGPIVATVPLGLATSFSADVPNGTYVLSVQALNAHGPGPESSAVTVTVPVAPQAPGRPTLLADVNGATVSFSWSVSGGGPADLYTFEAGLTPGFTTPLAVLPIRGATSVSFPGVPAGTYYARLTAHNGGGASPASHEVAFTVGGTVPPGVPVLHAPVVQGGTVTLTWTAGAGSAPSEYTLLASLAPGGAPIASVLLAGTSLTIPGVPAGTYYLRLTATNAAGTSAPSAEVTLTVP